MNNSPTIRTPESIKMNLFSDLLVTFLYMPVEIGWKSTTQWLAGDVWCRFFKFFSIFGLLLSSNILICICLDRFYAIVCPLSAGKAARNMKILLWSAWIISILSAAPQVSLLFSKVDSLDLNFPLFQTMLTLIFHTKKQKTSKYIWIWWFQNSLT